MKTKTVLVTRDGGIETVRSVSLNTHVSDLAINFMAIVNTLNLRPLKFRVEERFLYKLFLEYIWHDDTLIYEFTKI